MSIEWTWFFLALAALLPAMPLSETMRKFVFSTRRNASVTVDSLLGQWQNWADFVRAGAGTYLLTTMAIHVEPGVKGAGTEALMLEGAVLGVALLLQIVRFDRGAQFVAPIFYLCGITIVLGDWVTGGFGVFAGWLVALGLAKPIYQLPIMAVALGGAGYLLGAPQLQLILNCGLIGLPLVLSFMFRMPLLFVARAPIQPAA